MELMNIKTAFSLVNTLYGIELKESEFEEIALNAWELIGTKHTELREFTACTVDKTLELPCDCVSIETVTIPLTDAQLTSNLVNGIDGEAIAIEQFIDRIPSLDSPYYQEDKLIKYKLSGNKLQFDKDYHTLHVVYHGVLQDENELPLINDKEMRAIAAYVAYARTYREGLLKKDANIINVANAMKQD